MTFSANEVKTVNDYYEKKCFFCLFGRFDTEGLRDCYSFTGWGLSNDPQIKELYLKYAKYFVFKRLLERVREAEAEDKERPPYFVRSDVDHQVEQFVSVARKDPSGFAAFLLIRAQIGENDPLPEVIL